MAIEVKLSCIVFPVLVILAIAGSVACSGNALPERTQAGDAGACVPVPPDFEYFGPALTIAQAEAATLEKLAGEPEAPQVPFGYLHTEWQDLKNRMLTGDTIREFKANYYGGYVVLRRKCFVGEMIEWVH